MTRQLRVFLCHASQDKPAVRELYQRLKAEEWIDAWLDEEKLSFGQHWTTVIEDALHDADIVLIFLSRNSVQKEGFVQRELNYAWDISLEKPRNVIFLIPFRLDDCDIPRYLSARQWGDYFGEKKESTYQILLRSLRQRHSQKLQVEAAENAEREKAESDIKEKTERERVEQTARDQETHEEAKRIAHAKEKLEAKEKSKREKEARERAENIAREQIENEAIEKTKREQAEKEAKEIADKSAREKQERDLKKKESIKPIASTFDIRPFVIGGIVLVALLCFVLGGNYLLNNLPINETPFVTATKTSKPPTEIFTNIPFTPTPGLGTTIIGEDGMTLVFVPAGEFTMGSNDSDQSDQRPEHQVNLDSYWIDQTEVTNEKYTLCVNTGRCKSPSDSELFLNEGYANHPVVYVSWEDAKTYCEWAGRRLPTEVQWEKAARGPNGNLYPWGNNAHASDLLNYYFDIGTTEVGNYPAGASIYGALDMSGNVWEWVSSLYEPYPYDATDGRESLTSSGTRVLRGGWWYNIKINVFSAYRNYNDPSDTYRNVGFRCSRSP